MKNDEGKCPGTGARTFQEAMQRVLGDQKLAERVTAPGVRVDRSSPGSAYLFFRGKTTSPPGVRSTRIFHSAFSNKGTFQPPLPPSAVHVSTSVDAALVRQIAKDIAQFKKDGAS
jgi:hypothetical protein